MTDSAAFAVHVRPLTDGDRQWARAVLTERWGEPRVVSRGRPLQADELPGFVAELDGAPSGLLTYRTARSQLEVVSLDAMEQWRGVGTALVSAAVEQARAMSCRRLWLVTTNDNLPALRFYQRRGFVLSALYRGAVEISRKVKPTIPAEGLDGIPLRDELELELLIDRVQ